MKVGSKRKAAAGKAAGKGGRKVKVLDTEETSDATGDEARDKVFSCSAIWWLWQWHFSECTVFYVEVKSIDPNWSIHGSCHYPLCSIVWLHQTILLLHMLSLLDPCLYMICE